MKKTTPAILALAGALLLGAFMAWAFSLHGTMGLFRVNGQYHSLFLYLGMFGLGLLVLSLIYLWLKNKLKPSILRWMAGVLVILSLPCIIGSSLAFAYTNGAFSGSIGDTPPQLLMADGSGIYGIPNLAVTFNTAAPSRNTLTWGVGNNLSTSSEDKPTRQHVFMLRDLEPATTYTYRINENATYFFTTPSTDGDLHFAFSSDAHYGAGDNRVDLTAKMLAEIADPDNGYSLFFHGGDLVEHGFSASQWKEAFSSFSAATFTIPTRYTIGNHESLFAGFGLYKKYAYASSMDLQTGSLLWYRIDVGNVHFLVLDIEWSAESYTAAQAAWLEAQLKEIPYGDWKIVVSHGFYYASGSIIDGWKWYDNPETIDVLTPLFEKYGVNLVLSGHNHHIELLQHNSITYVIDGAFGGIPDQPCTYTSPDSIWYLNGVYGFTDVCISGNQCNITFRDSNNFVLKSFTIIK
jgi:predicted MPP superfamily phosphohydrolase